jgi:Tfp pilus assembly protein PilW
VKMRGFSLIELIVFILIISIVTAALMVSFETVLKNSPAGNRQTIAISLAEERMDLILGQKRLQGFSNFIDPCTLASPPAICTLPAGYSIAMPTIASVTLNGDSNYKVITVAVSGPGNTTLIALVGS